jgi:hypothetical protein
MVLFLMKPYWFLWTREVIEGWSLFANSLVSNLTIEFSRDMGLKSLTDLALSTLGMSVTKDELILYKQPSLL